MNLAEVAGKAADLMATYGHVKCTAQDDEGRMCIGGAVSMALTGDAYGAWQSDDFWEVLQNAGEILFERGAVKAADCSIPVWWNNRPETTEGEVIALLRETARRLGS